MSSESSKLNGQKTPADGLGRLGPLTGLRYPFRGARFVYLKHPSLARFWIPPILLTSVALFAMVYGVLQLEIVESFWAAPVGEDAMQAVGRFIHGLLEWIMTALLLVVGFMAVALVTSVLAAPFNDALSEAVEALVTGNRGPPFSLSKLIGDLGRTMGLELTKLACWALVMLPLLLVSFFVPVLGPVASVVGFCFTVGYFALDYVDWPASRRGLPVGSRIALISSNPGTMFGFGTGVWLFMFIPIVNLLFMPAAVAGGTLLFLDLETRKSSENSKN